MENQATGLVNDQLRSQLVILVKHGIMPQPKPLKNMVRARRINFEEDGASNFGYSEIVLCVNGRAHLKVSHSWLENGDHDETNNSATVTRCDCHNYHDLLINAEHADLIEKFLQTDEDQKLEQTFAPFTFPCDYLQNQQPGDLS
ncbi:MAG: hypothetical protein WC668_00070 [Patescibacteria group bacterium]|jgi:hypothetical protein